MSFMRTADDDDPRRRLDIGGPTELQVHIDGEFLCAIPHSSDPQEGQTIEDPRITEALGKLEVLDISFMGNMVFIKTERSEQKGPKPLKASQSPMNFRAAIDSAPVPDPSNKHSVGTGSATLGSSTRTEVGKNE